MKLMDADVKLLCCLVLIALILGLFGHADTTAEPPFAAPYQP